MCNQENFILKSNAYKLNQALPGLHLVINPAVKESHCKGRPKGGMFIAVPFYFRTKVLDISPGHWRLQAVLIKTGGSVIMLINSYFPVDIRSVNSDNAELDEMLEILKNLIREHQFSSLLFCGDINCDFLRNSGHVRCIQSFLEETCLVKSWDQFNIDYTFYAAGRVGGCCFIV